MELTLESASKRGCVAYGDLAASTELARQATASRDVNMLCLPVTIAVAVCSKEWINEYAFTPILFLIYN